MIQDKVSLITTAAVGVASTEATTIVTHSMLNFDVAQLTQLIVNVLIGIITIYKLIVPNKKKDE